MRSPFNENDALTDNIGMYIRMHSHFTPLCELGKSIWEDNKVIVRRGKAGRDNEA